MDLKVNQVAWSHRVSTPKKNEPRVFEMLCGVVKAVVNSNKTLVVRLLASSKNVIFDQERTFETKDQALSNGLACLHEEITGLQILFRDVVKQRADHDAGGGAHEQ